MPPRSARQPVKHRLASFFSVCGTHDHPHTHEQEQTYDHSKRLCLYLDEIVHKLYLLVCSQPPIKNEI